MPSAGLRIRGVLGRSRRPIRFGGIAVRLVTLQGRHHPVNQVVLCGFKQYRFAATPEAHLWQALETTSSSDGREGQEVVVGYMGVYVDDLLLAASAEMTQQILAELGKRFTLAQPEYVGRNG